MPSAFPGTRHNSLSFFEDEPSYAVAELVGVVYPMLAATAAWFTARLVVDGECGGAFAEQAICRLMPQSGLSNLHRRAPGVAVKRM